MSELTTDELLARITKRYVEMEDQRDGLLAALKANLDWIGPPPTDPHSYDSKREDAWKLGKAAIAAAEKE